MATQRAVGVERQRVDDPAAREGQPGLAREPIDFADRPEILAMRREARSVASQKSDLDEGIHILRRDRPEAVAYAADLHLDQRLQPQHAARTCPDHVDGMSR